MKKKTSKKRKPSVEVKDLKPGRSPQGGGKVANKAADAVDKYIRS